jgi:uncharacterized membrane protein YdbT with pleckstrin-like domain
MPPFEPDPRGPVGAMPSRFAGSASAHAPEGSLLWSATEGQVVNLGVFLFAALTFWLVLPLFYAGYRYLATLNRRYELTDQRLLVRAGILVKTVESLELYRVKDLHVTGNLLQSLLGRGRVVLMTTDTTAPRLTLNAVASPDVVATLVRNAVERCRAEKGVRAFDF